MEMEKFMQEAINEAKMGKLENGIPIGAVLVKESKIISRGHNKRVQDNNPIMHAEINCLSNAGRLKDFSGTTLYSTLMPCYLCAGAIIQFGIRKVVVGESDSFEGAEELLKNKGIEIINLNSEECKEMLQDFIRENREIWYEDIGKEDNE
jgi:cytosine/creatinine deaminase